MKRKRFEFEFALRIHDKLLTLCVAA